MTLTIDKRLGVEDKESEYVLKKVCAFLFAKDI